VLVAPFEAVDLPPASFDLVASATSFHWLDAVPALKRIHGLLRPGGAVALWWNVFGDEGRPDPFHDATAHLFVGHRTSPSGGGTRATPHGLDADSRLRDFAEAGFVADPPQFEQWVLSIDPNGVRNLYATYSNVAALRPAERIRLFDELVEIAKGQFASRVDRFMTTAIYTASRGP
jgi:SAM-dependent methyltransferase